MTDRNEAARKAASGKHRSAAAGAPDEEHRVVVRDRRRIDPVTGEPREPAAEPGPEAATQPPGSTGPAGGGGAAGPGGAAAEELAAARAEAAERTGDLQRITAEYANYRKRVDRDRSAVVEGATRAVLAALLPVLDDVDRARAHGDLTGTFKAVADQLETTLEKLGLQPFGEVGEPFDPMVHEAVAHQTSADVTVPTCVSVLRRGFRQGERLIRPALVAVADPAPPPAPAQEPVAPTDLPTSAETGHVADPAPADPVGEPAAGPTAEPAEPAAGPAAERAGSADPADPAPQQLLNEDGTPVAWFGQNGEPEGP